MLNQVKNSIQNMSVAHKIVFAAALSLLFQISANAQPVDKKDHPPIVQGVVVKSLSDMNVPDLLKSQAKKEISQMASLGYVESPEEVIAYIDRAVETISVSNKSNMNEYERVLKPLKDIQSQLKIVPSIIDAPNREMKVIGAVPSGVLSPEGWTGITRFFSIKQLGTLMLDENDYIASGGGLVMIDEAVNQKINGYPAILRIKKSRMGKAVTELTWASDRKIYTLSLNKMAKDSTLDDFIGIASFIRD